jgi:hypothetical protein
MPGMGLDTGVFVGRQNMGLHIAGFIFAAPREDLARNGQNLRGTLLEWNLGKNLAQYADFCFVARFRACVWLKGNLGWMVLQKNHFFDSSEVLVSLVFFGS